MRHGLRKRYGHAAGREDAIRPTDQTLSVIVPAPWGAREGLT